MRETQLRYQRGKVSWFVHWQTVDQASLQRLVVIYKGHGPVLVGAAKRLHQLHSGHASTVDHDALPRRSCHSLEIDPHCQSTTPDEQESGQTVGEGGRYRNVPRPGDQDQGGEHDSGEENCLTDSENRLLAE